MCRLQFYDHGADASVCNAHHNKYEGIHITPFYVFVFYRKGTICATFRHGDVSEDGIAAFVHYREQLCVKCIIFLLELLNLADKTRLPARHAGDQKCSNAIEGHYSERSFVDFRAAQRASRFKHQVFLKHHYHADGEEDQHDNVGTVPVLPEIHDFLEFSAVVA